ncbi:hypothetical protein PCANB_000175 [Pneumocystis canis]|nr:hypothetical protein PCK1_000179 [Pneumocystis canis]KAG5439893.1 hypothetical protein PCANB_000175 [Pneumocystis canis]
MTTSFSVFLSELKSLKTYSSVLFPSTTPSQLVLENNGSDDFINTDEESWCKKAEKLVDLEQEICEYRTNKTVENIEKALNKLENQINETSQIYSLPFENIKK